MFKGTEKHHIRYRKKKISCDDLKIGIGKHESEKIVLNVFKDLKGTLVRMTTQLRNTAESRKWGKNKREFGGVRSGGEGTPRRFYSRKNPWRGELYFKKPEISMST